jgi:hypothetical protein
MATTIWNFYGSTGPDWTDIGANTLVFSGSGGIAEPVQVGAWQDESHIGSNDPGPDQCGANHANNVKFIDANNMDVNGGGSEAINDTNLTQNECTLQVNFSDAASVATSSARLYCFDGNTVTVEAPNLELQAFEQGVAATAWTEINDDSANVGGDNAGERLDLADQGAATSHDFYIALSFSPETVGAKTDFDLGLALTYS